MDNINKNDLMNGIKDSKHAMGRAVDSAEHYASETARDVRNKGSEIFDSVKTEARHLGDSMHSKVDQTLTSVGNTITGLGSELRRTASVGNQVDSTVCTVAEKVEQSGQYLTRGISTIGKDLAHFAQRHPIACAAVGLGLGMLMSRATRTSTETR